ncbi:uncharacterized protein V6R79_025645 [Siganus canaliculatus]
MAEQVAVTEVCLEQPDNTSDFKVAMDKCTRLFKDSRQIREKYREVRNKLEEAKQHIEESREAVAQMKYEYEFRLSTKNALLKYCEEENELLLEKCQFFEKKANAVKNTLMKKRNEHQKIRFGLKQTQAAEQKPLNDYSDTEHFQEPPEAEGQAESWWRRWGKPISKVALSAAVGFAVGAGVTIAYSKK